MEGATNCIRDICTQKSRDLQLNKIKDKSTKFSSILLLTECVLSQNPVLNVMPNVMV